MTELTQHGGYVAAMIRSVIHHMLNQRVDPGFKGTELWMRRSRFGGCAFSLGEESPVLLLGKSESLLQFVQRASTPLRVKVRHDLPGFFIAAPFIMTSHISSIM